MKMVTCFVVHCFGIIRLNPFLELLISPSEVGDEGARQKGQHDDYISCYLSCVNHPMHIIFPQHEKYNVFNAQR
jgi:hypothetical protein